MKRRIAFLTASLGLALMLCGSWWLGRISVVAPRQDATSSALQPPRAAIPPRAAGEPSEVAPPRIDIEDETERAALAARPVREQIAALDARASRGNADAACRLGTAIERCVQYVRRQRSPTAEEAADFVARHPENEQEHLVELMARNAAHWEAESQRCAGMTEADQKLGMRYLLAAAQRGSTSARLAFIVSELSLSDTIRDPELARLYAEHAPGLFERMMSEGDPRAIEVLHDAAHAHTIESRRAAWHAIPESLRNPPIARALWRLRRERGVAFAQPERHRLISGDETPIDRLVLAEAERLWQERFERSVETAKLRERSAREWDGRTTPRTPHSPPDPCGSDLD